MVSCFSSVHGAHRGTPLCRKHLAQTGRAQSPAPTRPTPKSSSHKPEEPLLQSIRRTQSADFRAKRMDPILLRGSKSNALLLRDLDHQGLHQNLNLLLVLSGLPTRRRDPQP